MTKLNNNYPNFFPWKFAKFSVKKEYAGGKQLRSGCRPIIMVIRWKENYTAPVMCNLNDTKSCIIFGIDIVCSVIVI